DAALRPLKAQLGPLWSDTAVLMATEFGRTAAINGTRGTDHGTATAAFLVGGAVRGGRVIADWPALCVGYHGVSGQEGGEGDQRARPPLSAPGRAHLPLHPRSPLRMNPRER